MRDGVNRAWNCADAVRENAALREIIRSFDEDIAAGLGECNSARARADLLRSDRTREQIAAAVGRETQIQAGTRERFSLAHTEIVFSASFRAARICGICC